MREKVIMFFVYLATLLLAGFLLWGMWGLRSFFYYDAQPVEKTVIDLVKPECLK